MIRWGRAAGWPLALAFAASACGSSGADDDGIEVTDAWARTTQIGRAHV